MSRFSLFNICITPFLLDMPKNSLLLLLLQELGLSFVQLSGTRTVHHWISFVAPLVQRLPKSQSSTTQSSLIEVRPYVLALVPLQQLSCCHRRPLSSPQ